MTALIKETVFIHKQILFPIKACEQDEASSDTLFPREKKNKEVNMRTRLSCYISSSAGQWK